MTTCIRCGADINRPNNSNLFETADGSATCPASLPGEAAVHRDVERLPRPIPQQRNTQTTLRDVLFKGASLFLLFEGAQTLTRGDYWGQPTYQERPQGPFQNAHDAERWRITHTIDGKPLLP